MKSKASFKASQILRHVMVAISYREFYALLFYVTQDCFDMFMAHDMHRYTRKKN